MVASKGLRTHPSRPTTYPLWKAGAPGTKGVVSFCVCNAICQRACKNVLWAGDYLTTPISKTEKVHGGLLAG